MPWYYLDIILHLFYAVTKFVSNQLCCDWSFGKSWWVDHCPSEVRTFRVKIFTHSFHVHKNCTNDVAQEKSQHVSFKRFSKWSCRRRNLSRTVDDERLLSGDHRLWFKDLYEIISWNTRTRCNTIIFIVPTSHNHNSCETVVPHTGSNSSYTVRITGNNFLFILAESFLGLNCYRIK